MHWIGIGQLHTGTLILSHLYTVGACIAASDEERMADGPHIHGGCACRVAAQLFETEAGVSGDEASSDEGDEEDDGYLEGFIDDGTPSTAQTGGTDRYAARLSAALLLLAAVISHGSC
jgi:hypothetical protein